MVLMVRLLTIAVLAVCAVSYFPRAGVAQDRPAAGGGDARLEQMLRSMQDYMKSNDLQFDVQFSTNDAVLGRRYSGRGDFSIRQPNLFRVTLEAQGRTDLFVSDGKSLWIYRRPKFVEFQAKKDVLGTMYAAAGLMFMPSRILDAFWTVGNEDVRTQPIADAEVSGRTCRGVRMTRFEDTFDLWLEAGEPHRPCKLLSKRSDGSSQSITTHVFEWRESPKFADDAFRFAPPKGATRTESFDPF